jgi:LysR family transcriptional regulator, transcriptional activator of the cysJI operon
MRDFRDVIDSTSLKAFYHAALTENFTAAAERAHLTQSGISQHIAKLEDTLKAQLFVRVGKKVRLTESGEMLLRFADGYLDHLDGFINNLEKSKGSPQGLVSYGMPWSCMFTPHFTGLLETRKNNFKDIKLDVKLCSSEEVVSGVISGKLDFGFVTHDSAEPELEFSHFAEEEYVLVAGLERCFGAVTYENLTQAKFISYPGFDNLFWYWRQAYFPRLKKFSPECLNMVGRINSIHGAINMVKTSMGVSIFPRHCVLDELKSKELYEYRPEKSKRNSNNIYIVQLKDRHQPLRVQTVLKAFWDMKKTN